MSTTPRPDRKLLLLFSVIVVDLIGFGIVLPILPFYVLQFGSNATVLGLLLASYSAMQFIFSSLWGKLSDKIGRRKVILITLFGNCLALILQGLAPSLWLLFLGRILSGIFAANISVAAAYVTDITTDENRSKGMGMIGAAFGVGFILGPAIGGPLSKYGYHIPILVAAGLNAINFFYAWARLPEPPRHHHVEEPVATSVLSNRPILKLNLLQLILTLGFTQLEATFAFFMKDKFGYDALHVAYVLVLMAFIMIVIQGGAIRGLTKRFGENRLLVSGAIILALSFFLVPHSPTITLLLIPLSLSSVGRGLCLPSLMSLVSKKAPQNKRGSVMGTFQASASLGRAVGPAFAGLLYDHWHPSPFYTAALLMVVVFVVSMNL